MATKKKAKAAQKRPAKVAIQKKASPLTEKQKERALLKKLKAEKLKEGIGKDTVERVKNSRLPHKFIYENMEPPLSATNFSRLMTGKQGGVTLGICKRINEFLDNYKA